MLSRSLIGIFRFFGSADALLVTTSRCFFEGVKNWGCMAYPTGVLSFFVKNGVVGSLESFTELEF